MGHTLPILLLRKRFCQGKFCTGSYVNFYMMEGHFLKLDFSDFLKLYSWLIMRNVVMYRQEIISTTRIALTKYIPYLTRTFFFYTLIEKSEGQRSF